MNDTNVLNFLKDFSNGMAEAVVQAGERTVLVNARKRLPVSGIVIKPDLVLSVDHGIENEDRILVMDQNVAEIKAMLVGRDPGSDLALLRIEKKLEKTFTASAVAARVGQPVIAVGKPETEGVQASSGIVTAVGGGLRTMRGSILDRYIATDATPYPGFSGGPLISLTGEVLGVNTSGLIGGMSLAIPIQIAIGVASQLEQFGRVKRGFLGIRSQRVEIQAAVRETLKIEQNTGLLMVGVENDGPAGKEGLMVGDMLIAIGGHPVSDQDDLFVRLSGDVVGKTVSLKVIRGGQIAEIGVVVGERP